ncbi:MAG: hypothetical protein EOO51_02485 [Flavobacterium sp.]|nr:MAG: hypothetical protein EOO51_02485 [Flavobacterium sp.]
MQNRKILFITFDMSGYYDSIRTELESRFEKVAYYNTAKISFRYRNIFQRAQFFLSKIFSGKNLKRKYKYQSIISAEEAKTYDMALVIRPDVFTDGQLSALRKTTKNFIAYYHDSISNIPRKKNVIRFFDRVYSYEKKDVAKYNLTFLPNFIYLEPQPTCLIPENCAFSVMSNDYRVEILRKVARSLASSGMQYRFFVMDDKPKNDSLLTFIQKRMNNAEVITDIQNCKFIVDIHKFGIQDGLTFRVFEAMAYRRKLITTNANIKTYDFYDPNNIFVIENVNEVEIPRSFLESDYREIPPDIYRKYTVENWVNIITS